jgi:hypothetical protein
VTLKGTFFTIVLAIIAVAYAAVGQAGATGYIAAMGIAGYTPDMIRPATLALNTLVAAIRTVRFAQAGPITWWGTYSLHFSRASAVDRGRGHTHPDIGLLSARRRVVARFGLADV